MPGRALIYQALARNEGRYWAVTIEGWPEWGETTAWHTSTIEEKARDLIVAKAGINPDRVIVEVTYKIGRRR